MKDFKISNWLFTIEKFDVSKIKGYSQGFSTSRGMNFRSFFYSNYHFLIKMPSLFNVDYRACGTKHTPTLYNRFFRKMGI